MVKLEVGVGVNIFGMYPSVPSKIYPGYPGDIPDIFFDFFNKNFSENISGVSGVKVSKCKKKFGGLYLLSFHKN